MGKYVLAVIILFFASFVIFVSMGEYRRYEVCQKFITMAGDEESVAYLYDWVNQNLEDKDLLKTMGYSGRIDSSRVGERSFRSLGINWSKLGINAHYASVSVIRYEVDRDDFMNPDNIKAIRFGEGRNSLILKLDPTFRTESLGGGTNRSEVQVVNDKASVYCD